jgi:hypothetical protein
VSVTDAVEGGTVMSARLDCVRLITSSCARIAGLSSSATGVRWRSRRYMSSAFGPIGGSTTVSPDLCVRVVVVHSYLARTIEPGALGRPPAVGIELIADPIDKLVGADEIGGRA